MINIFLETGGSKVLGSLNDSLDNVGGSLSRIGIKGLISATITQISSKAKELGVS